MPRRTTPRSQAPARPDRSGGRHHRAVRRSDPPELRVGGGSVRSHRARRSAKVHDAVARQRDPGGPWVLHVALAERHAWSHRSSLPERFPSWPSWFCEQGTVGTCRRPAQARRGALEPASPEPCKHLHIRQPGRVPPRTRLTAERTRHAAAAAAAPCTRPPHGCAPGPPGDAGRRELTGPTCSAPARGASCGLIQERCHGVAGPPPPTASSDAP